MEIEIAGHHFVLLPQKAVFWKEQKTLLIGDLHLGKITHFRKAGIAIPSVAQHYNFATLDTLVMTSNAERIIFLGDLFHHHYNSEWDSFALWRKKYPALKMVVVLGNHDILPMSLFNECNMCVEDHLVENGFLFTHHPLDVIDSTIFVFCGHIHPVFCLRSAIKQSIKLPCFVKDEQQMVLPSFGVFTGGYEMNAQVGRQIYVIAEDKVIRV